MGPLVFLCASAPCWIAPTTIALMSALLGRFDPPGAAPAVCRPALLNHARELYFFMDRTTASLLGAAGRMPEAWEKR